MRRCSPLELLAVLALASPALAQTPPPAEDQRSGGIEEITITAEKRETNLQDTPIAVTAITSEAIEEQGLEDFNDVQFMAPAVVYGEIADMAQITMRGIGVDISTIDAEPGVALHQDGVYRGGLVSSSALFFDAERVEVLRGPQGTLYGRNSTGGSLNVITKLPGETPKFDGSVLYGDYSRWRAEAFGDVPIIDGMLALRGGFAYDSRGGYTDNSFTGNEEDDARYRQAKLAALFTPTETLEVALRFSWLRSEVGGAPFIKTADHPVATSAFISASNPAGTLAFPGVCDAVLTCVQEYGLVLPAPVGFTGNPRHVDYDRDQDYIRDNWDTNLTVDWQITDGVSLKWISSYLDLEQDLNPGNNDGVRLRLLEGDYFQSNEEWSQELNLTGSSLNERLDWIFGFFYYDSKIFEEYRYTLPDLQATYEALFGICAVTDINGFCAGAPLPSGTLALFGTRLDGSTSPVPFLEFSLDQDLASWALFTQQTFHVTDAIRVTGGFRWTQDTKVDVHSQVLNLGAPGCRDERAEEKWSEPTGKVGIDADVAADTLVYAAFSRGFKAGGYNVGTCGNTYDPEFVNAYEIGAKTQLFENTLQLNVSGFYNDYSDLQVRKFVSNASIVSNAASAQTYGIELEALWVPIEPVRIESSISWLHARFEEYDDVDPIFPLLGSQDLSGNNLLRAPDWKFSLAGQYTLAAGAAGDFTLRGEYAYTAEQFHTVFNNDFGRQAPYNIGNLRLIWQAPEDVLPGVSLQVFGENLGDVDYVTNHAPNATTGSTISTYGPPRTWGVQINYEWDAE
jgi:iron complex outermembrane recepter protein